MSKRKFEKGDDIYEDFLGDGRCPESKLVYCPSCERWIPPPYIHTCYSAKEVRRLDKQKRKERK